MSEPVLLDGRYRVHERLGSGMFGAVYRAEQRALAVTIRQVAVKLFDPAKVERGVALDELLSDALKLLALIERCDDPVVRDRFVTCFDAGLEAGVAGRPYVVMELVVGDLKGRIGGNPLPVRTAMEFSRQLGQGLAFMHRHNYLHRDLKPANVLLTRWGSVKIGDFGLATPTTELLRRAPTVGDLAYQPPEALTFHQFDPSADVHAVGLICYEMLTGALPHSAEIGTAIERQDHGLLLRVKTVPAPPPSERNLELRAFPAFERVVLRAMAPYKADRYRDGSELLAAIDDALSQDDPEREPADDPVTRVLGLVEESAEFLRRACPAEALERATWAKATNDGLPPNRRVASVYRVLAEALMDTGDRKRAVDVAKEGLQWRRCRTTLEANAIAFRESPDLHRVYRKQAKEATE